MGVDIGLIFQIAGIGITIALVVSVLELMGRKDFVQWVLLGGFMIILFQVVVIINDLFDRIKSVFLFQ